MRRCTWLSLAALPLALLAGGCLDTDSLQHGDLAQRDSDCPGCNLDGPGMIDAAVDARAPEDLTTVDAAMPDLAMPDLAMPDLAMPDLTPPPDLTVLDLTMPDLQTCGDGKQDNGETDIDCGGLSCITRCALTQHCAGDSDCASSFCLAGTCAAGIQLSSSQTFGGNNVVAVATGDFDGLSGDDIVFAVSSSNVIALALNDGTDTATFGSATSAKTLPGTPVGLAGGQLKANIADVGVAIGTGSTTFDVRYGPNLLADTTTQPMPYSNPSWIAAADFDKNGSTDFAVVWSVTTTQAAMTPLLGSSTGAFTHAGDQLFTGSPLWVETGDVDGDGAVDVITLAKTGNNYLLQSYLNAGNGVTWTPKTALSSTDVSVQMVVGDFSGDGKLDVATASGTGSLDIFPGKGDGTFLNPTTLGNLGHTVNALVAGDYNADGKTDLLVLSSNDSVAIPLASHGDLTFAQFPAISVGAGVHQGVSAHFRTNANIVDVVLAEASDVRVLKNGM